MGIIQKFKNAFIIINRLEDRINECQENIKLFEEYNLHPDIESEKEKLNLLLYIKTGNYELIRMSKKGK